MDTANRTWWERVWEEERERLWEKAVAVLKTTHLLYLLIVVNAGKTKQKKWMGIKEKGKKEVFGNYVIVLWTTVWYTCPA